MSQGLQLFSGTCSRNALMKRWECGRKTLQSLEDLALDTILDFREGLVYSEASGYYNQDGSVSVVVKRSAELEPYHVWVLYRLLRLRRRCHKNGESLRQFEKKAFKLRKNLSKEHFVNV